jgi:hypothetical protein
VHRLGTVQHLEVVQAALISKVKQAEEQREGLAVAMVAATVEMEMCSLGRAS